MENIKEKIKLKHKKYRVKNLIYDKLLIIFLNNRINHFIKF